VLLELPSRLLDRLVKGQDDGRRSARRENDAQANKAIESVTSRFPVPWRIVGLQTGFAVEDATGKQIGVFYGRAPDCAGHTGIMTMDEARQMAIDFARLPELLEQNGKAE
jgi:hypothetical protein